MTNEQIVRTYADMVYRIAYGYAQSEADRDDIFQDAFLAYFKKKREFTSEEHRKAWLIRVTINCAKDFLAKRPGFVPLEDAPPTALHNEDAADEAAELLDALRHLPAETRDIIYMHYYEDMSLAEIAMTLSMNINTVKTRLARGREKLRDFLGGSYTL